MCSGALMDQGLNTHRHFKQRHLLAKTSSPQEEALLTAPVQELGHINPPDFVVLPASRKRAVKTCQVS